MTQLELTGTTLAGKYRVEKQLGAGGMGAVYLAVQSPLERRVALKVLHPSLTASADAEERFVREAQSSSHLSHPNIVAVHDFGRDDKLHYLVMELVDGESVLDLIAREGKLPLERAAKIVAGVCDALTFAHERGVIHRDIKPANVMVLRTPPDFVKVLDFGIAKVRGWETLTADGAVLGTPGYLPPDIFEAEFKPGPETDLYALGVMLFEMVTGRAPFTGTPHQIMKQVMEQSPPRPSELAEVPPAVEALILELLEKDPKKRPSSAAAVKARMLDAVQLTTRDLPTESLEREALVVEKAERSPPPAAPRRNGPLMGLALSLPALIAVGFAVWRATQTPDATTTGAVQVNEAQTLALKTPSELRALCAEGNADACEQHEVSTRSMIPTDEDLAAARARAGQPTEHERKRIQEALRPKTLGVIQPAVDVKALEEKRFWQRSFATGEAEVQMGKGDELLADTAKLIVKKGHKIQIVGETLFGEDLDLGQKRAEWMRARLLERGVPAASILPLKTTIGASRAQAFEIEPASGAP